MFLAGIGVIAKNNSRLEVGWQSPEDQASAGSGWQRWTSPMALSEERKADLAQALSNRAGSLQSHGLFAR